MFGKIALAALLALAAVPPAQSQSAPSAGAAVPPAASKMPSEKQMAARNRMKLCGAEWREKKASMPGTTWRQFAKECLSRKS